MPRSIGIRCGVKTTSHLGVGHVGEHLVDLRHVAMRADAVGRDAFVALRIVKRRLRLAAAAADAALAIDDDALRQDRAGPQQRREREDRRRRVAAGVGHQRSGLNSLAINLGQAVDGFGHSHGSGCSTAYHFSYSAGSLSR